MEIRGFRILTLCLFCYACQLESDNDNKKLENDSIINGVTDIIETIGKIDSPPPFCAADKPVVCQYVCCLADQVCADDGYSCQSKCQPPAPISCVDNCCPNNYECVCEEIGGYCKPVNAVMCDCQAKIECDPLEDCIESQECKTQGKFCKPSGSVDCAMVENCYCEPGFVCTDGMPSCCPADAPIPCGDYCCPADNDPLTDDECVYSLQTCKASGETYCEQWDVICPIGKQCMEREVGCKDTGVRECEDGGMCTATQVCVGLGKGINRSGCCENDKPVACGELCCDGGSACGFASGTDYCVSIGYIDCGAGIVCDAQKQKCWKGQCIPIDVNDCGEWWCSSIEVCVTSPSLQCCPLETPKECAGKTCCGEKEGCYAGLCVPEGGAYCPKSPAGYCLPGYACGGDSNAPCCCNDKCMPSGSNCCENIGFGHYCLAGKTCCGSGCILSSQKCCAPSSGTHCPIGYQCSQTGSGCLPNGANECLPPDPGYCQGTYWNCNHKIVNGQTKTFCCTSSISNCVEANDLEPYIYSPPPGP